MITRKLGFFYWVLSDGPNWAEMLCLYSSGGMLNNLILPTGPGQVDLYHVWSFCHGGNMPESHDLDDDDDGTRRNQKSKLVLMRQW